MFPDLVPVRRALISVSDKTGLVELAAALVARGIELVSTGGTAQGAARRRAAGARRRGADRVPRDARRPGQDAAPDGARRACSRCATIPTTRAALDENGIETIDLLVVNLYPFEATVAAGGDFAACIENIDIGGPAMLRSAAKNHGYVAVVTDVEDYAPLLAELGGARRRDRRSASAGRRR